MKQKITILSLLICTWISVQAYEVFEHNQGDESHLIRKSKVMNGRYATIWDQFGDAYGNLCIEFDDGMLEVYDEHYSFFNGEFYSKEGDIAVISPTSIHILRMEDPATSEYNLSLKIEYNLVGGKKCIQFTFKILQPILMQLLRADLYFIKANSVQRH